MSSTINRIEMLEARCSRYRNIIDSLGVDKELIEAMVTLGQLSYNDARYLLRLPEVAPASKPPLGIIPKELWDRKRKAELADAMNRYMTAGKKIPEEWLKEYNEIGDRYGEVK